MGHAGVITYLLTIDLIFLGYPSWRKAPTKISQMVGFDGDLLQREHPKSQHINIEMNEMGPFKHVLETEEKEQQQQQQPTNQPTNQATNQPTNKQTNKPTHQQTNKPTNQQTKTNTDKQ